MSSEAPHYHGHRQRLRERYAIGGMSALAPYEIVELILFLANPRADMKPLAKKLMARFVDLPHLLNAQTDELKEIPGVGDMVIHVLQLFRDVGVKQLQQDLRQKTVFDSWQKVIDYCLVAMAHEKREQLRLLFLDGKNQLIGDEVQQIGSINHTPLYPREVVKRALEVDAAAIILVHNHPTGDPTPSQADIDTTREVDLAARSLGLRVYDHLIIGKGHYTSMKSLGLF